MDDAMLWIVGGIALAVVVTALVWVLRHRGGTGPQEHPHHYATPAVTHSGTGGRSSVIFGGNEPVDDVAADRTVPLSRRGGAGWRDGGGADVGTPFDAYAANAGTWGGPESDAESVHDPVSDPHVTVHDAGERPVAGDEADERRGGHW
jgi:hypothetical protein